MRSLCLLAFGCLAGLIVYTSDLKIKTRALEAQARELGAALQDEGDFLALMRAEVSYVGRPERIEEMARTLLKMEPVSNAQLVPWSAITPEPSQQWQPQIADTGRKEGIAALIERSVGHVASQASH